jgi:hypothetical protein
MAGDAMRRKAMIALLFSVCMALCQDGRRPSANPNQQRETPLRQLIVINDAAKIYYSWLKRVPTSMKQLGPSEKKIADSNSADLIAADLASGIHDGYKFTLTETKGGWTVRAVPMTEAKDNFQTTYIVESRISQPKAMRK